MPFDVKDLELERTGTKVIVPEEAELKDVISYLQRRLKDEETDVSVREYVPAHPADGAIALVDAMTEMFGAPNFAGNPNSISVEVAPGETRQIQWGALKVPQIAGYLECSTYRDKGTLRFLIGGEVKKKHLPLVKRLADRVRELARTRSIYKGKAIMLPVDQHGGIDELGLKFLDLRGTSKDDLVFPESVSAAIQANLFTPIEQSDACRAAGVSLKRGVLLAGRYGTGKTLTARVAAKVAQDNGWTFILVQRVTGLAYALEVARTYAPCVVFAEDLDRAVSGAERTVSIDDVLNTLDGIESKKDEIIVVLTTNHVEQITRAMLRPGRIDALIEVTPPDAQAARRLIRKVGGDLVDPNSDFEESGALLAGQIPAVITEAVQRAKLYAMTRTGGGEAIRVTDADLTLAVRGMAAHLRLMEEKIPSDGTPTARLGSALSDLIAEATTPGVERILERV